MLVSLKTMWEADKVREEEVEIFNIEEIEEEERSNQPRNYDGKDSLSIEKP